MHEIARRWVSDGSTVTWMTAQESDAPSREHIDGIDIRRAGGPLSVYTRTALRLLQHGRRFDAVIDCQNGIPFFSPLFTRPTMPIVQVLHHVHQDQFAHRFSPIMASLGRILEGPVGRQVYANHAMTAVSTSTRQELRSRLKVRVPIFIVPNGTTVGPTPAVARSADPTIVIVNRLVAHKRIDMLLRQLVSIVGQIPRLRIHIVGDGPELPRLRYLASTLGLGKLVTFHGRQPDHVRDALLEQAWLTASVSAAEGWGCSIIEAAARGVPCVGMDVPGIRDSVVHQRTGWLVHAESDLATCIVDALRRLSDDAYAAQLAEQCRTWAACFDWDRSAELLAGVVEYEMKVQRNRKMGLTQRRIARSDIATVVEFASPKAGLDFTACRATDEVSVRNGVTRLLLNGCDEIGAQVVLRRLGISEAQVRLASRYDLLTGRAVNWPANYVDSSSLGSADARH
jgi:glycosyltransferase involved in cell wall biosynthesis